jgi:hypothetical protein
MSLLLMLGLSGRAQERNNAAVAVDALRVQLIEVQEKEGSLRLRAQQLEEELKPENIEHVFAGIGSTRPEELREARRRQLTIERDSVKAQLKLVELTKERLETAVAAAEGRAYQESACRLRRSTRCERTRCSLRQRLSRFWFCRSWHHSVR